MTHLSRVAWLVPLIAHLAYVLATSPALPEAFGAKPWSADAGVSSRAFLVEWLAIVGLANVALLFVHVRLPRFGDRTLAVPRKDYWLGSPARRAELVERLRGFLETALLLLNVFFLAIYQNVYQSNAARPAVSVPSTPLVVGFMGVPLLLVALAFAKLVLDLRRAARGGAPPEGVDG
ncbi:MAG: hypothetical protein M0R80_14925 [Proteobacteria bacterium]|nr:hypothetical protein [Pseudomonadota bacterium]